MRLNLAQMIFFYGFAILCLKLAVWADAGLLAMAAGR